MVFRSIVFYNSLRKGFLAFLSLLLISCSTIESTMDETWDSITSAGDYLYDSIAIWEDDEPEQSEAVIIEEAVEVPEFAMPDESVPYIDQNFNQQITPSAPQVFSNMNYDPIYRSQRQYYYVGPNGTPMPAPPPPPFPQYSIDQARDSVPYSYYNNLNAPPQIYVPQNSPIPPIGASPNIQGQIPMESPKTILTKDEEMELFGIQNNCIRVVEDYVNGGYICDDFD